MNLKEEQEGLVINWILEEEGEGKIWRLEEPEGRYHKWVGKRVQFKGEDECSLGHFRFEKIVTRRRGKGEKNLAQGPRY